MSTLYRVIRHGPDGDEPLGLAYETEEQAQQMADHEPTTDGRSYTVQAGTVDEATGDFTADA